jgi:hypothetical protein
MTASVMEEDPFEEMQHNAISNAMGFGEDDKKVSRPDKVLMYLNVR